MLQLFQHDSAASSGRPAAKLKLKLDKEAGQRRPVSICPFCRSLGGLEMSAGWNWLAIGKFTPRLQGGSLGLACSQWKL